MAIHPDTVRRITSAFTITIFFTLIGIAFEFLDIGMVTIWGPS